MYYESQILITVADFSVPKSVYDCIEQRKLLDESYFIVHLAAKHANKPVFFGNSLVIKVTRINTPEERIIVHQTEYMIVNKRILIRQKFH